MKKVLSLCFLLALAHTVTAATIIVNDSWADGGRTDGPDALDAAWWSSVSSSGTGIEVSAGSLGLVTGTSGRGIHGTFAPQTLDVNDSLRATFTFKTPATIGTTTSSGPIRVALADYREGMAADLNSSSTVSQPLYEGLPAYMVDWDFNTIAGDTDTSIREHDLPGGRLLGTTSEWTQLGTGPDEDYAFAPNTEYIGVISITRTGPGSVEIFGSLSQGGNLLTSHSETDSVGIATRFGVLAFWVNSNIFGSVNTSGTPDNGIDFSNIQIETLVVPEPSSAAILGIGMLMFAAARKSKTR